MASSENEAEIAEKAPSPLEDDEANAADEVAEPVTTTGTVSEAQKSDVKPEKVEDNEAEAKQEVEGDLNESTQEPDSAMMEDEENVEAKLEKIEKEDSLEKFEDANIEKAEEERKVDEISSSTTGEEIKNEIVDETKEEKGTTNEAEPKQEADLEKPTVNNEAAMKEEDNEVEEAKEEKVKEEKLNENEMATDAEKPIDDAADKEEPPAAVVENIEPPLQQTPIVVPTTAQLDTVQPQQQVSTASDIPMTSSKPVSKPVKVYSMPQTKVSPQVQQMKSPQHKSPIAVNQVTPQQQPQQQQQQTNLKILQSSPVKSMGTALKSNTLKSNESLLISNNNNNNVTPVKNNPAVIHKSKPITEEDGKWHTVGIYNGLTTSVSGYIDNNLWSSAGLDLNTNNLPDLSNFARIPLEPGTAYRFRLRAINSVGASEWSEVSSFKTCLPGFPGAPSAIKISKSSEGAHLTWEPPPTCRDINEIVEYSVYLAIKPQANAKDNKTAGGARGGPAQLAFVRVYVGAANQCIVPHSSLTSAHVDCTNKPAIIFRIAARNEKGYGPATQVRWLQDAVNAAPASSTTHTGTSLLASARVKTESAGPSPSKRLKLTNTTRFTANE